MKKKFREISVKGITYAWSIKSRGKEHSIIIWLNKQIIHSEAVRCEITPSLVKEMILKLS